MLTSAPSLCHRNGTIIVTGDYNSAEVLATRYVWDNNTVSVPSECDLSGHSCRRRSVGSYAIDQPHLQLSDHA
jgi:hypothetical protein